MDLDDTLELLDSTVPVPYLDPDEEEVFFGCKTTKEKQSSVNRRDTLVMPVVLTGGRFSLYFPLNSINEEGEVGNLITDEVGNSISKEIENLINEEDKVYHLISEEEGGDNSMTAEEEVDNLITENMQENVGSSITEEVDYSIIKEEDIDNLIPEKEDAESSITNEMENLINEDDKVYNSIYEGEGGDNCMTDEEEVDNLITEKMQENVGNSIIEEVDNSIIKEEDVENLVPEKEDAENSITDKKDEVNNLITEKKEVQDNPITDWEELQVREVTSSTMEEDITISCERKGDSNRDENNTDSTPRELIRNEHSLSDDIIQDMEWRETGGRLISDISGITLLGSCSGNYDSFSDDTSQESVATGNREGEETDSVGESFIFGSVSSQLGSVVTGNLTYYTEGNVTHTLGDDSVFKRNSIEPVGQDRFPDITVSRPSGVYGTAPSSPLFYTEHVDTDDNIKIDFDTSAEEILLYDMFGEDYDEVVDAMTIEERKELKLILVEKSKDEILNRRSRLMSQPGGEVRSSVILSVGSTCSPFSLNSTSTMTPSPRRQSSHPEDDQTWSPVTQTYPLPDGKGHYEHRIVPEYPHLPATSPACVKNELFPSSFISNGKISPLTSTVKVPWMPPSPRPKETVSHHRLTASCSPRKTIRRIEATSASRTVESSCAIRTLETSSASRMMEHASTSRIPRFGTPVSRLPKLVQSPTPKFRRESQLRNIPKSVSSPVAEYVRNNPTPRLIQNVVAKEQSKELESTLMEVENIPNLQDKCPLPFAVYTPTELKEQTTTYMTGREYDYIPDAYGEVTRSASVTKHLGRRKIDKWRDDGEGRDHSFSYRTPRQGAADQSLIEMSVLETKIVKEIAMKTPRRM